MYCAIDGRIVRPENNMESAIIELQLSNDDKGNFEITGNDWILKIPKKEMRQAVGILLFASQEDEE